MAYVECVNFGFGLDKYWVLVPENLEENYVLSLIRFDNPAVFVRSISRNGITINVLISNSQEAINGTLQPIAFAARRIQKEFKQERQRFVREEGAAFGKFVWDSVNEPIVKARFSESKQHTEPTQKS